MDEKRYFDNIKADKHQLYVDSLSDIAEALGDSLHNPISISLLCLKLGITDDEKGKLILAFRRVLRDNQRKDLSIQHFRKALEEIVPHAKELKEAFVVAIIKAAARNYIPELMAFAAYNL